MDFIAGEVFFPSRRDNRGTIGKTAVIGVFFLLLFFSARIVGSIDVNNLGALMKTVAAQPIN